MAASWEQPPRFLQHAPTCQGVGYKGSHLLSYDFNKRALQKTVSGVLWKEMCAQVCVHESGRGEVILNGPGIEMSTSTLNVWVPVLVLFPISVSCKCACPQ